MTEAPEALTEAAPSEVLSGAVLREALNGLTASPKTISPWLFYDERGSALFEQITALPEYYLTRTERGIFQQLAPQLAEHMGAPVTVAELGAGSASKTGILLAALARTQPELLYQPIDVSGSALAEATVSIRESLPGVELAPQVANYITDGYKLVRPAGHKVLALYIGSSIGNFSPEDAVSILRNLRQHLEAGDALLLGVDLAPGRQKSIAALLSAYDDAAGVTAAFNKNVLVRFNRELDANFNLDAFAHRALWNADESRIEMHLESLAAQTVDVAGRRIDFLPGETIHTENSYKFTRPALLRLLADSGFDLALMTQDPDQLFAVALAKAI